MPSLATTRPPAHRESDATASHPNPASAPAAPPAGAPAAGHGARGAARRATACRGARGAGPPRAGGAAGTAPGVGGAWWAVVWGVVASGLVLTLTTGAAGAIRYHVLFAAAP